MTDTTDITDQAASLAASAEALSGQASELAIQVSQTAAMGDAAAMPFFIVGLTVFVLACFVAARIFKSVRARRLDWRGIAFMAAFVALAFYLRHATGMG